MADESVVVEIENLKFSYPAGREVINIRHLQIEKGEHLFLHGPSGCGKTTFLGLLTGVLRAKSGKVSLLGRNLSTLSGSERDAFRAQNMGYIFQQFNLIPYLSVLENIVLPCWASPLRRKRIPEANVFASAEMLSKSLGIERYLKRNVRHLSVGQQQRVAVARALIGKPPIIIADEPTSALDQSSQEAFLRLLIEQSEASEATVILVSHNQGLSQIFSKDLSLLEINQVKQSEAPEL